MILFSSYLRPNDIGRLISPVFPFEPSGYCLKWFYHMKGKFY